MKMNVELYDMFEVIGEHSKSKIEFILFSGTKNQYGNKKVFPTTLYVAKNGYIKVRDSETEPFEPLSVAELISNSFELFAKVMIDDVLIGERTAVGEPFIAKAEEYFHNSKYEQLVRDDIISQITGREMVMPEMTEETAGSLMKGFIAWRKAGNE